jgi:FMN phosphatase YigB (HAD superfamily)
MGIKNVLFDLGAVLINIDYNKTAAAFQTLGYSDFEKMYSQFKSNNVFDNLETGHISETEFYEYMLEVGKGKVTRDQVTGAWNAMLIDFRIESLEFLKRLKQTHQLFLLSNTNTIHKAAFDRILKDQTGYDSLDVFFKKVYFSHEIGFRKPNEDIFNYVLKDAGISAEETFFIDDLYTNIDTARKLGFKTHLLLPNEKIEKLEY